MQTFSCWLLQSNEGMMHSFLTSCTHHWHALPSSQSCSEVPWTCCACSIVVQMFVSSKSTCCPHHSWPWCSSQCEGSVSSLCILLWPAPIIAKSSRFAFLCCIDTIWFRTRQQSRFCKNCLSSFFCFFRWFVLFHQRNTWALFCCLLHLCSALSQLKVLFGRWQLCPVPARVYTMSPMPASYNYLQAVPVLGGRR